MGWIAAAVTAVGGLIAANQSGSASKSASRLQARTAERAAAFQEEVIVQARADLEPFRETGVGQLEGAAALNTPQGQASFLRNNPLFELGLENLNRQTNAGAASRGRFGAGGTAQQIFNNAIAAGSPLLENEFSRRFNLAALGSNAAGASAQNSILGSQQVSNALFQGANAQAAGILGQAQATNQAIGAVTGNLGPIIGRIREG